MSKFTDKLESSLPHLWRFAYSLTRDEDRADDLVQDCVERALRKKAFWIASQPLRPWLFKILLNVYRTQLRGAKLPPVSLDQVPSLVSHDLTPDERLAYLETIRRVDLLPDEQKEALLTVVVGGMSYQDASKALQIPQGTLMSRINRARNKLKEDSAAEPAPRLRSVS